MKIHISSDEVNVLIYRYLIENGFSHSAFSFSSEAGMSKNPFWITHAEKLPPNALVSFLQKAMMYIYVEFHTDDDTGEEIRCHEPFSIFRRHDCWFPYERDTEAEEEGVAMKPLDAENAAVERNGVSMNNDTDAATSSVHATNKRSAVRGEKVDKSKKQKSQPVEGLDDEESNFDTEEGVNEQASIESDSPVKGNEEGVATQADYGSNEESLMRESAREESSSIVYVDTCNGERLQKKLENYALLIDHNESSDSGALSEWSPSDPRLIVTNFALETPQLYRVPRNISGVTWVPPLKDLQGPLLDNREINPGSASCWKHDGSLLATGYESGHASIWTNEGVMVATMQASLFPIICAAFSTNGSYLAAATADGGVWVWKVEDATVPPIQVAAYTHVGSVIEIDWGNDFVLSSGSIDKSVIIYDLSSDKRLTLHQESEIAGLRWNQSGTLLAIVDASPVVKVWKSGQPIEEGLIQLVGHHETVIKAEWLNTNSSPNHPLLITVSMDKTLIMWDVRTSTIIKSLSYLQPPTSLRTSPNGTLLAVSTYDYGLRIYKMPELELLKTYLDRTVIPHVSWNCLSESIVYNVFNSGKTVVIST